MRNVGNTGKQNTQSTVGNHTSSGFRQCKRRFSIAAARFSAPKHLFSATQSTGFRSRKRKNVKKNELAHNKKKPCLHCKEALFWVRGRLPYRSKKRYFHAPMYKILIISTLPKSKENHRRPSIFQENKTEGTFCRKTIKIGALHKAKFRTPKGDMKPILKDVCIRFKIARAAFLALDIV